MQYSDIPIWASKIGNWAGEYYRTLRHQSVRAQSSPGDFILKIPTNAPELPESMEEVFADFKALVPNAMTHWQHPRFFAYFPANAAPASILAEQIISTMACNCMLWQTSPAATELEQRMVEWFRDSVGLPKKFTGLIHDSATTATLCAVLTMREKVLDGAGLIDGLSNMPTLRIYGSKENHSSIDKAARLSGIGQNNLVKVATDDQLAIRADALRHAIQVDLDAGLLPAGVIICVGGTANGAFDDVKETIAVAKEFDLYCHVDAAWAGAAMVCPEFRHLWQGVENADSIVINPNKWTGAQVDCSLQFLADPELQAATLGLRPEYLQTTGHKDVVNFNELTIPLGRRFRALKLWFVFRVYGLQGLREMIRKHIRWVKKLESRFDADPNFEIVTSCPLALFSFRFAPTCGRSDVLTSTLLEHINNDGRIYLTQSVFNGRSVIRMTAGTFECTEEDVMHVYDVVCELAAKIDRNSVRQASIPAGA